MDDPIFTPPETRKKLLVIGEVLGSDAYTAIKVWRMFEDFSKIAEDPGSKRFETAIRVLGALDIIHKVCVFAQENDDE